MDSEINSESFYPEGPLLHKGYFYYVEYSKNRVMIWDGTKNEQIWEKRGCGPASIIGEDNILIIACYDSNSLDFITTNGKAISSISADKEGNKFSGPNDFVADHDKGIYFTASGVFDPSAKATGAVYYMSGDMKITKKAEGLHYPNGIALINNDRTLLVNEHFGKKVTSFDIDEKGKLVNRRVFFSLKDGIPLPDAVDDFTGPDGIEVHSNEIFICHYGASQILVTDLGGTLLQRIAVPLKYVTNIDIHPNGNTLFVTAVEDANNEPYKGKVLLFSKKLKNQQED